MRGPTTDQHGSSWLLGFPSGPVRPSLDNLILLGSPEKAMLMPTLVRTPIQHESKATEPPSSHHSITWPPRRRITGVCHTPSPIGESYSRHNSVILARVLIETSVCD